MPAIVSIDQLRSYHKAFQQACTPKEDLLDIGLLVDVKTLEGTFIGKIVGKTFEASPRYDVRELSTNRIHINQDSKYLTPRAYKLYGSSRPLIDHHNHEHEG